MTPSQGEGIPHCIQGLCDPQKFFVKAKDHREAFSLN